MAETSFTKQWSVDSLLASFFSWLGCRDLSNLVFQQRTNCYHSERHQQQYLWRLHQHFMAWVTFTSLLPNVVADCKQFIINCWLRAMLEKWVCRGWFRETRGRERPWLQPVRSPPYFLNYNGPYQHAAQLLLRYGRKQSNRKNIIIWLQ